MTPVMSLNNLQDTTLWKRLKRMSEVGEDGSVASALASNLVQICDEAFVRMKAFPSLHPQYTLHDETHLLRVTELMSKVIPGTVLEILNPIEMALLILAAHFHDQGMVLDAEEINALETNPNYILFFDNWIIEHPNLREVQQRLRDKNIGSLEQKRCQRAEQELLEALLTDYYT